MQMVQQSKVNCVSYIIAHTKHTHKSSWAIFQGPPPKFDVLFTFDSQSQFLGILRKHRILVWMWQGACYLRIEVCNRCGGSISSSFLYLSSLWHSNVEKYIFTWPPQAKCFPLTLLWHLSIYCRTHLQCRVAVHLMSATWTVCVLQSQILVISASFLWQLH